MMELSEVYNSSINFLDDNEILMYLCNGGEIKGFNEAYNAMLAKEAMKRVHKNHISKRVKELMAEGVDRETAKVMAEVGL